MRIARSSWHMLLPSLALGLLVVAVVSFGLLDISPTAMALPALRVFHAVLSHLHTPIVDQCPGSLPGGC